MGRYHTDLFERISPDKRRFVLDAAAAEFAVGGFAAANINIIADRASVSVGSLYQYFGSKENCFLAVLEDGFEELEGVLQDALGSNKTPLQRIETILRLIPEHSRRHKNIVRLYNELTGDGLTEGVRDFCERFEALSSRAYAALVKEAIAAGSARSDIDADAFAFLMDNIFTMLQFSYACDYFELRKRVVLGPGKADDDQFLVDQALAFISAALGGRTQEK